MYTRAEKQRTTRERARDGARKREMCTDDNKRE